MHGEVFGLIVRARNVFSNIGASLRTLVGGEVEGLHEPARRQPRTRRSTGSARRPREHGANAVLAMRFDCNEIAGIMSEVAAYGTAVTVRSA